MSNCQCYDTAFKTIEVAQKNSKEAAAREFKVFQVYSDSIGVVNFTVYHKEWCPYSYINMITFYYSCLVV